MPPRAIAAVMPALLTRQEPIISTAVHAATPRLAAPDARPASPTAIPIATVEMGEIITIEKEAAIKMHIRIGCSTVNELIPFPIMALTCAM